jgi:hypothetical protein
LKNEKKNQHIKIEGALTSLEIVRMVCSYKITSFSNISENFTLTYFNLDQNNSYPILVLPPMPRTTQRSLKVFDASGNRLSIIPSYRIHEVLMELSTEYLETLFGDAKLDYEIREKLKEQRQSLKDIFVYGDVRGKIDEANHILSNIIDMLPLGYEIDDDIFHKLLYLINVQVSYLPFVKLKKPIPPGEYHEIIYISESPKKIEKSRFLFYSIGRMEVPFLLSPFFIKSYHLEIKSPEGINICDFDFSDLENSIIQKNKGEKANYIDKKLLYITFSPEETNEIRKRIDNYEVPTIIPLFQVNPLLCILYYLVHIANLSPLFIKFLLGSVNISQFIASITLGASIFISASIYALDKKIVLEFAFVHLLISCIIIITELILFGFF